MPQKTEVVPVLKVLINQSDDFVFGIVIVSYVLSGETIEHQDKISMSVYYSGFFRVTELM